MIVHMLVSYVLLIRVVIACFKFVYKLLVVCVFVNSLNSVSVRVSFISSKGQLTDRAIPKMIHSPFSQAFVLHVLQGRPSEHEILNNKNQDH